MQFLSPRGVIFWNSFQFLQGVKIFGEILWSIEGLLYSFTCAIVGRVTKIEPLFPNKDPLEYFAAVLWTKTIWLIMKTWKRTLHAQVILFTGPWHSFLLKDEIFMKANKLLAEKGDDLFAALNNSELDTMNCLEKANSPRK